MKILFLLPPSEGKKSENKYAKEELSFDFEKPIDIAQNVTEKDLKCKGDRFIEGLELNKNISSSETIESIKRYSGVMFNAIDYSVMSQKGQDFFEENFLIFSGMYGIVKPLDKIGNYKLPIDTKGLFDFWGEKVVEKIAELKPDFVVNLLPISYSKMVGLAKCRKHIYKRKILLEAGIKIININFLKPDGNKISHGVKKIKGEWIKNICENNIQLVKTSCGQIDLLSTEGFNPLNYKIVDNENGIIDVNIIIDK